MRYFFETLKLKNETLFYFGLICLLGAFLCFLLAKFTNIQVLGVNAWAKPFKFCVSTAILSWSMAYYMQFLDNQYHVGLYSWSLVILLSLEIVLITYQSAQGKLSHFNQDDATGTAIFSVMAMAITLFTLHTLFMTFLFFSQASFQANELMILGIKLGLVLFIVFALEGFVMGSLMRHTVGAADGGEGIPILKWSKQHGDLRVAHFFGMHALQIIPLLSVSIARNKSDVWILAIIYFIFVSATFIQAVNGKPFLRL